MGLPASVEEYLRAERESAARHEYHDGDIIAMAGGSYEHSLIISNCNRALGNALVGKPCRVLDGNLKVGSPSSRLFVYPELQVICGPPQFDPRDPFRQTVTNPRLVVEVLSPSTEAYDRRKFDTYRKIESIEEYVLVSERSASIETFFRQPDGTWLFSPYAGIEAVVRVRSLTIELKLTDVYVGVEFPPESPAGAEPSTG